jgi:hypothetical protein
VEAISEHTGDSKTSIRKAIVAALVLLGAGAVAPLAWAQDPPPPPPPPEVPAINQYVETIPSGSGGQAVGVGKSRTKPLAKKAAKKLSQRATPLAPKLHSIATSSAYGAPQQALPRSTSPAKRAQPAKPHAQTPARPRPRRPEPTRSVQPERPVSAERTALSAAVSAATDGGDRGPVLLLAAIVLLTTAAGVVAAAKRAQRTR